MNWFAILKPRRLAYEQNPYAPKRWPKKVYFLDGPLKGETHKSLPCHEILILENRGPLESARDGLAYLSVLRPTTYVRIRYVWDTIYENGGTAFARLSPASLMGA